MNLLFGIAHESFSLFARMAPYLLLGIAAAGAIHVVLPESWVARKLGGGGIKPPFRAALFGVPLPLCSCGVVPVAASLKKSGAAGGATVSFLITTPTSGVDSILATYSLLGGLFAIARVVASFVIGLAAGAVTALTGKERLIEPTSPSPPAMSSYERTAQNPILASLSYGFGDLLGGMAKSLALGTLLGGTIAYLLPPGALETYVGAGILSYFAMMLFGIPLYVCASGSIPLAAALLAKGITPGAALVFLIAGPATNAATMGVVLNLLGKRGLAIFLGFIAVGAMLAGIAMDGLLSAFPALVPMVESSHDHEGMGMLEIVSGALLGILLLFHLASPLANRIRRTTKGDDTMVKITVPDMTCHHCAGTITKAVTGLDGVKKVFADPNTKAVEVDLEDDSRLDGVVKAIADAGYSPEVERP
jgi:hypothetical protein